MAVNFLSLGANLCTTLGMRKKSSPFGEGYFSVLAVKD